MWIKVKIRKTNQEALIDTDQITALFCPDFTPSGPMQVPGAGVYGVMLRNGNYLEIEPGKAIDQFAEELQAQTQLTASKSVGWWARIWRALKS